MEEFKQTGKHAIDNMENLPGTVNLTSRMYYYRRSQQWVKVAFPSLSFVMKAFNKFMFAAIIVVNVEAFLYPSSHIPSYNCHDTRQARAVEHPKGHVGQRQRQQRIPHRRRESARSWARNAMKSNRMHRRRQVEEGESIEFEEENAENLEDLRESKLAEWKAMIQSGEVGPCLCVPCSP